VKKLLIAVIVMDFFLVSISAADNWLYVVNGLAQTLSRINLDTGAVDNHIMILGVSPNDIKIQDHKAYILNSTSDNIQAFDLDRQTCEDSIEFGRGGNPWEMYCNGGYIYVTNWMNGYLYEVDISARSITRDFLLGGTLQAVYISDGKLFVTDTDYDPNNYTYGEGKLYYSDLPGLDNWRELTLPKNPQHIIRGPDGNLHVVCTGDYVSAFGCIYIIDPVTVAVVDSIEIGGSPMNAAVTTGGLVMLAAGGWAGQGEVYCYNGITYEILNGPGNPIHTGTGAIRVTADSSGNAYSCNFNDGTVDRIDRNRNVADTYNVGDGPQAAAFYNPELTGIAHSDPPLNYELDFTAYPNPFNNLLAITFEGRPHGSGPDVHIYNIRGELVESFSIRAITGEQTVYWNAGSVSSGVYFIRAVGNSVSLAKKVTLLK
jgi:hypothetical protein